MKISRLLMGLVWLFGVTSAALAASNPSRLEVRLVKEQANGKDAPLQLADEAVLTAADFAGAELAHETEGQVGVSVRLTPEGAAKLRAASTANVGKRFAIVVDGSVVAAPKLHDPITGGAMLISLKHDELAAQNLATAPRAD